MSKVVIFGAGDIARLAHFYFQQEKKYEIVAFTVDKEYMKRDSFCKLPLIAFEEVPKLFPPDEFKMFIAISYKHMNKIRAEKYNRAKALGYELVSYVSNKCSFLTEYPVGDNCFILEDNTIQPFVKIGNNVTIWSGNHIGHDSIIEDHCFLSSHVVVSGNVNIGSYSFIGVNATISNSVNIAQETFIGLGAIITKDTISKGVYLTPGAKLAPIKCDEIKL